MKVPRAAIHLASTELYARQGGDSARVLAALIGAWVPADLVARARATKRFAVLLGSARGPAKGGGPHGLPALQTLALLPAYLGAAHEALLGSAQKRRSAGAHHTEPAIARDVVTRTLRPLLGEGAGAEAITVCDPAMGSGVFLIEAALALAEATGAPLARVIEERIFGFDIDPIAVALARFSLFAAAGGEARLSDALAAQLEVRDFTAPWTRAPGPFRAVVGNPPWVAYMGRAAQPLPKAKQRDFKARFRAFAGYPTLQGVFVERACELLAPGGRLGMVVPTSMADLGGYAPARRAHDRLAQPDAELPDYGATAFEGVFQPAMAILSTRRTTPADEDVDEGWPLAREDLTPALRALLAVADRLPAIGAEHFAERGYQSDARDRAALHASPARGRVALSSGSDVTPFALLAPSYFVEPAALARRLRPTEEWRAVDVLVRQTARFPMACRSDGRAFRNSVLAGFARDFPVDGLVAYLNASPVRCLHYYRYRDARQGMPQLKISHLRSTPVPADAAPLFAALAPLGREGAPAQSTIDALVADAWGLSDEVRAAIGAWTAGPGALPRSRRRPGPAGGASIER